MSLSLNDDHNHPVLHGVYSFFAEGHFVPFLKDAIRENPWFTADGIHLAASAWESALSPEKKAKWLSSYPSPTHTPKRPEILLILAGNIPWVGLHDVLCALVSPYRVRIKLSSKDRILMRALLEEIMRLFPPIREQISLDPNLSKPILPSAIIATGADSSIQEIKLSYPNIPQLFRGNRQSIAVLNGQESPKELQSLMTDLTSYHGLGCRNVSLLFIKSTDSLKELTQTAPSKSTSNLYTGFLNAIKQQRAVFEINQTPYLQHKQLLFTKSEVLASPMGVVHYQLYEDLAIPLKFIEKHKASIQCIVGSHRDIPAAVPFGKAQYPELWDYADQIDTLNFINRLS